MCLTQLHHTIHLGAKGRAISNNKDSLLRMIAEPFENR